MKISVADDGEPPVFVDGALNLIQKVIAVSCEVRQNIEHSVLGFAEWPEVVEQPVQLIHRDSITMFDFTQDLSFGPRNFLHRPVPR